MEVRDFKAGDALKIDELAVDAFSQYQHFYDNWPAMVEALSRFSLLADSMEIIVAEMDGNIVGAVGYLSAEAPKADFFPKNTPIMRMLVVDPEQRGKGIGRQLAQECIDRARRDGSTAMALHTSQIMTVALPMYERMGFKKIADAPDIHGVQYSIYRLEFNS